MADIVKTTDHINRQFVDRTSVISTNRVNTERIKTLPDTLRVRSLDISSSSTLFYDHPVYGFWDNFNWASDNDSAYYSESVSRVVNRNNTFTERFEHLDFVDNSSTTASVSIGSGINFSPVSITSFPLSFPLTFNLPAIGEVFRTKIIVKDDVVYNSFDLTLEGTNTDAISSTIIKNGDNSIQLELDSFDNATVTKFYLTYSE